MPRRSIFFFPAGSGTLGAPFPVVMSDHRAIVLACLALGACTSASPSIQQLPSDEVLRKAADASAKLETAEYAINGTFDYRAPAGQANGTMHVDGVLADAGKQVQLKMDLTGSYAQGAGQENAINGTTEIVVIPDDGVYLKLDSLVMQPDTSVIPPELLSKFTGTWWLLPDSTPVPASQITPDPSLLRAQSDVVKVVSDHGIVTLGGIPAYHYDVSVDSQKFVRFLSALAEQNHESFDEDESLKKIQSVDSSGELWIDAVTFNLLKVRWDIRALPVSETAVLDVAFTADMKNQNAPVKILPPKDAKAFNPALLLSAPLTPEEGNAMFPQQPSSSSETQDLIDAIQNQ